MIVCMLLLSIELLFYERFMRITTLLISIFIHYARFGYICRDSCQSFRFNQIFHIKSLPPQTPQCAKQDSHPSRHMFDVNFFIWNSSLHFSSSELETLFIDIIKFRMNEGMDRKMAISRFEIVQRTFSVSYKDFEAFASMPQHLTIYTIFTIVSPTLHHFSLKFDGSHNRNTRKKTFHF